MWRNSIISTEKKKFFSLMDSFCRCVTFEGFFALSTAATEMNFKTLMTFTYDDMKLRCFPHACQGERSKSMASGENFKLSIDVNVGVNDYLSEFPLRLTGDQSGVLYAFRQCCFNVSANEDECWRKSMHDQDNC